MAKQRVASTRRQHSGRQTRRSRSATAGQQPYLLVGGAAVLAILAFVFVRSGGPEAPADPAQAQLASATRQARRVKVLTGSHHTVYHSVPPHPPRSAPRADGLPTLVGTRAPGASSASRWNLRTPVGRPVRGRMVFAEKSVDDDRQAASRYGIRGTPTFVLVDANGQEVARFGFQRDEQSFAAAIEAALAGSPDGPQEAPMKPICHGLPARWRARSPSYCSYPRVRRPHCGPGPEAEHCAARPASASVDFLIGPIPTSASSPSTSGK